MNAPATQSLSNAALERLSDFIAAEMGLSYSKPQWKDLERGIQAAAQDFGMDSVEACVEWLMSAPLTRGQIETLAGALTIGETYFFREKAAFTAFSEKILPRIIAERQGENRSLRIWSAGCCTGEEAYTIAILVKRLLPDLDHWRVTVHGTDVNPRFLHKAAQGVYGEWSFRNPPPWLKDNYFTKLGEQRYEVAPAIRKMVKFSHLNLAKDFFPSSANDTHAIDVIFCRNVLMYFAEKQARRAVANFRDALVDGGWLIVSPTEVSSRSFSIFTCVQTEELTLYQKTDAPIQALPWNFQSDAASGFKGGWASCPPLELSPFAPFAPLGPESSLSLALPLVPADAHGHLQRDEASPAPSRYTEAAAFFEQGKYMEAAGLLPSDPFDPTWNAEEASLRARMCANQGELVEATQWSEKALAMDKMNAVRHYLHAIILQERGLSEEAAISFRRALYLDPDFIMAHFALGSLEWRRKRFRSARRHFQNTLTLARHCPDGEVLRHSDGLVAGNLKAMVESNLNTERLKG